MFVPRIRTGELEIEINHIRQASLILQGPRQNPMRIAIELVRALQSLRYLDGYLPIPTTVRPEKLLAQLVALLWRNLWSGGC